MSPFQPAGVLGVAQLVRQVSELLNTQLGTCRVRGELSGFMRSASGHSYFSLKDADGEAGLIRCAMFRRAASLLTFQPADGQRVEVRGRIGVYEPRGELQFVVESMEPAGAGALYEQFLRLRARLEATGLFDAGRKRALPAYPAAVGVVTSLGAAALQDVLAALARRAPHVRVLVYPSLVQGVEAPAALVQAIALASRRAEVEVLIVCRGGGALEDLWAFNDERVVRAIAAASMPVVVGVGHETDVTLADLAADLRAPTPTAAAEIVAPSRQACLERLDRHAQQLARHLQIALDRHAQRLDGMALRLARADRGLHRQRQRLSLLDQRWTGVWLRIHEARRSQLLQMEREGHHAAHKQLTARRHELGSLATRLHAIDPQRVLERGYAWLSGPSGAAVTSVQGLEVGMTLRASLADGTADLQVQAVPALT